MVDCLDIVNCVMVMVDHLDGGLCNGSGDGGLSKWWIV